MARKVPPHVLKQHQKFLKRVGADKASRARDYRAPFPNYDCSRKGVPPCSNSIGTRVIYKRRIKSIEESAQTLSEIAAKSKRVAPAFNKGPTMYITPGSDPKDIGKK